MIVNLKKLVRDSPAKPFWKNFDGIYGLGPSTAKEVCTRFCLTKNLVNSEISAKKLEELSYFINDRLVLQIELQTIQKKQKNRHIELKTYKGNRYLLRLPANGQRTHSNAAFSRGLRSKKEDKKRPSRRESIKKKRPLFFHKI